MRSMSMEKQMILTWLWFLFLFAISYVSAWDNEELEIFDLVEEVNSNFYEVLGVQQDADSGEIKKAYRRLSLILHPDKNDAPDAEIKFRQLVAIYEVLRDNGKRACYDAVLENGLPDWRQPVYYYRRVRKMGLFEMTVILFPIITIGQYIVSWASYWEKKFTAETKVRKKKTKKGKPEPTLYADEVFDISPPSFYNTLPFQLVWLVGVSPSWCYTFFCDYLEERRRRQEEELEDEDEDDNDDTLKEKRVRRRKVFELPELDSGADGCLLDAVDTPESSGEKFADSSSPTPPPVSGGLWTDDDLTELVKLVKKYPIGTRQRWEKVAAAMNRPVAEVTFMAKKVKDDCYRFTSQSGPSQDMDPTEEFKPKKLKTKGGKLENILQAENPQSDDSREGNDGAEQGQLPRDVWSQSQQKALENALAQYTKGVLDRWDRIANCVPEKSKEECMLRYKQLVALVKKKKESEQSEKETVTSDSCSS